MATTETLSGVYSTTDNSALGDDGLIGGALAKYLRTMAEPNRFLNYELVPLASEATVPSGQGKYMTIPNFINDTDHGVANAAVVANEALPFVAAGTATPSIENLRATSVQNLDREQTYFRDGFYVTKLYKNVATVQGEFERIAQFIMKGTAQTQEKLLQNQIIFESGAALTNPGGAGVNFDVSASAASVGGSGLLASATAGVGNAFYYVAPNPDETAWGSLTATDVIVANQFALARKFLKSQGTPGFQKLGGRMAAVVGPDAVYRLHTQVVGGPGAGSIGDASLTFEQESMNRVRTFTDAVIGDLFGFRLIETNYPITISSGTTDGPSATVDCEINVLFGPDAFYVTPHANLNPQFYISGFNNINAFNPTGTIATFATDYLYGAVRGAEAPTKICLMPCAT